MQLTENTFFGEHERYRLIRLLGQGGFSEVWLAEDTQAGLTVALKVYAPGKGLDEDGIKQFSGEFSLVFNLNHPNLLRPTHYDVYERMPYLIMPYCEQGSSIKMAGQIDEKTAWKFLHDVASGLAYLHTQKPPVIHQDIKPDNILMDKSGSFLITDFGISSKVRSTLRQIVDDEENESSGAGTMAYMAPERFSKDNLPIMAGDVWALGASLYELITGLPPFGAHGGLLLKGGADIPDASGQWSSQLKKLIQKCLQKDPWSRPKAKDIVKQAKRRFNPEADTEPETEPKVEPKAKTPLWKMAAALIVGILIGFSAVLLMNRPAAQETVEVDTKIIEFTHTSINHIEKGDRFADKETTWRFAIQEYLLAKELTNEHALLLPNMGIRIERLQAKMDSITDDGVKRAKILSRESTAKALSVIENDVLSIDPEHKEGNELKATYERTRR